jgi:hypothetical protein
MPAGFIMNCPICKQPGTSGRSAGAIFRKIVYECDYCHTAWEQTGQEDKALFAITKVGEEYTNAHCMVAGKKYRLGQLATQEITVIPDEALLSFAQGNLDDFYIDFGDVSLPEIALKAYERIILALYPVDYLEARKQSTSDVEGSFIVGAAKDFWYHVPRLHGPRYSDSTQQLDSGWLVATNKRLIFIGHQKQIDQPFGKVTAITLFTDGLGLVRTNKLRTEYFTGDYHWPLVGSILLGLFKKASVPTGPLRSF